MPGLGWRDRQPAALRAAALADDGRGNSLFSGELRPIEPQPADRPGGRSGVGTEHKLKTQPTRNRYHGRADDERQRYIIILARREN